MDKEEKAWDMFFDAYLNRAQDLKNAVIGFIKKLETENLNWPQVLDNFALISGQVNTLLKILRNEKTPHIRNKVSLPLLVSADPDENLLKITENRIPTFSHDVIPNYLRTKPDPEMEIKEQQANIKAASVPADMAQKQVMAINKIVNNLLDSIKANRDAWENDSSQRASAQQTSSLADTGALICAITMGKGLKPTTGSPKGQPTNPQQPPPSQPSRPASGGKIPSAIKTNIKAGGAMHPYGR